MAWGGGGKIEGGGIQCSPCFMGGGAPFFIILGGGGIEMEGPTS